jgi:hypothetical protein
MGFILPDNEFLCSLIGGVKTGRHHCVSIRPKWPNTDIYLDSHGNIYTKKGAHTDVDRLRRCKGDWSSL